MKIALVNQSARVTDTQAALMASACDLQVRAHLAPAWGIQPVPVRFFAKGTPPPADYSPLALLDSPDEPDALGYHTEDAKGRVWGRVFVNPVLDNGGEVLHAEAPDVVTVASVLSHEVCELIVDPACNRWVDGPPLREGSEYSMEVCDPVEGDSYVLAVSYPVKLVSVSNFVLPAWFDPLTPKGRALDHMSRCRSPFMMTPNGYMIVRKGPGHEKQVMGAHRPAWRSAPKPHHTARKVRRGVHPDHVVRG